MNRTPFTTAAAAVPRVLLLLLLTAACSPALNWRTVALPEAGLSVALPCKPERASRSIELAGSPATLHMVGCDADGATFAVSHTVLADPAQLVVALAHWRAAAFSRLGPGAAASAADVPYVPAGALPVPQSLRTTAQGRGGDGRAAVMQGVWFARAAGPQLRLYHAVVYASGAAPRADAAEPFFAGLALQ